MNTMQFEFDAVVNHLYKQGAPASASAESGPGCYYRSPTGLKCAVGCRIPDEIYDPAMDEENGSNGTSVDSLILRFGNILPPEIAAYENMFAELQTAHDWHGSVRADGKFDFDRLSSDLKRIAYKNGLTFTEPKRPD